VTHHGGMTTGSAGQRVQSAGPASQESEWLSGTARSLLLRAAVMAATALVAFAVVAAVALGSATGQRLDRRAMDALSSPQRTTHRLVEVLSLVSVWSVALVLAGCVVLALLRRRVAAAVAAMVLVAGANVTTQVLKYDVLTRPDIGFGSDNTLPSGHTTVAVSLALAGVLVAPVALRGVVALLGSGGATLIGAGTVVGRWHRPGDVVAGVSVCLLWAALALAVLALLRRDRPAPVRRSALPHVTSLVGAAVVGLVIVSAGVRPTGQPYSLLLAAVSLAAIGIACAGSVGWVSRLVNRVE
jgi:membrane-associated phospholipid phosphatase